MPSPRPPLSPGGLLPRLRHAVLPRGARAATPAQVDLGANHVDDALLDALKDKVQENYAGWWEAELKRAAKKKMERDAAKQAAMQRRAKVCGDGGVCRGRGGAWAISGL